MSGTAGVVRLGPLPARRTPDLTLRGPAFEWVLWGTTVRLAAHDPHHLSSARRVLDAVLVAVESEVLDGTLGVAAADPALLAWTADLGAGAVAADLGVGVLVGLGGQIATAGPGQWNVLVRDRPAGPAAHVRLPAGAAVATAHDQPVAPRATGLTAVTVVEESCAVALHVARTALGSSASGELGGPAGYLRATGVTARLVDEQDAVTVFGGWPADGEVAQSA